jgi:hypothetical protein
MESKNVRNLEGEGDVIVASHAHCMEAIPLHDCFENREFDSICQIKFSDYFKIPVSFLGGNVLQRVARAF